MISENPSTHLDIGMDLDIPCNFRSPWSLSALSSNNGIFDNVVKCNNLCQVQCGVTSLSLFTADLLSVLQTYN